MKPSCRIIIMAKAPQPGQCKTRLIPALGANGAAQLAAKLLVHTVHTACAAHIGPVELCASPAPDHTDWAQTRQHLPAQMYWSNQGDGDLGERMGRAVQRCAARGEWALLIGTDCPAITPALLHTTVEKLATHDAVIAPTADGGYALLGLRQYLPSLFNDIPWSTPEVAAITQARMASAQWKVFTLEKLHDIDEPSDLVHLPHALIHTDSINLSSHIRPRQPTMNGG